MSSRNRALLASRYQADGMAASSPQKLVVLMFARMEADLARAIQAIEDDRVEDTHLALVNAQEIVFELRLALDTEAWPEGADLGSLYDYLQATMVEANLRKSVDLVRQCLDIVIPLSESWAEAYRLVQQDQQSEASATTYAAAGTQ